MSEAEFMTLVRALGEVIDDTPVRVVPGRRTYLTGAGAIPLHTDHSAADLIAWRCESQDDRDGASLLLDGWQVVAGLEREIRATLTRTILPAMIRLGDAPRPTAVLSDVNDATQIFFAPWLEPMVRQQESIDALHAFGQAMGRQRPSAHRLRPGEVLIVDNHRILHGRGPLLANSSRRLRRCWIRRCS